VRHKNWRQVRKSAPAGLGTESKPVSAIDRAGNGTWKGLISGGHNGVGYNMKESADGKTGKQEAYWEIDLLSIESACRSGRRFDERKLQTPL
jgi:hypothetical protein